MFKPTVFLVFYILRSFARTILLQLRIGSSGYFRDPSQAPRCQFTLKHCPPIGHTYGFSKGNPVVAACGGIFWDHLRNYLDNFGYFLGHHPVLIAIILAIETAYYSGWMQLQLKSNSMLVIQFVSNVDFSSPWMLRNR